MRRRGRTSRQLAGALLACLACTSTAALSAPASGVAATLRADGYDAVAMRRHGEAHLAVEARVDGVAGLFILDTGAGRTVIDRAAQARFDQGREVRAGGAATGAGGGALVTRVLPGTRLRIGDYRDDAFTVHFLALDHVNAAFARQGQAPVDGVIGADVLERGGAVIDYPGMRLYLRNPDTGGANAAPLPPPSSGQR